MKKKRLPRKIKKKWKKMGIRPVFIHDYVINVPTLSDLDMDRIIKAWGKFKTEPLKLKNKDER
jgi:hypothetical protein